MVPKRTVNKIRKRCVTRGDVAEFSLQKYDKDPFLVCLFLVIHRKRAKIGVPVSMEEQTVAGVVFLFERFRDRSEPKREELAIFLFKDRFNFRK